jgi:hypothetical protein
VNLPPHTHHQILSVKHHFTILNLEMLQLLWCVAHVGDDTVLHLHSCCDFAKILRMNVFPVADVVTLKRVAITSKNVILHISAIAKPEVTRRILSGNAASEAIGK